MDKTSRSFYKAFFIMTLTVAFQNLIVYGVNLADSVMMGAYDETALSGVGICNNIQFLLHMCVMGTANGITVIASRYWGEKDIDSMKKISAVGNIFALCISAFLFILCAVTPAGIISLFTDKETVAAEAVKYLIIIKYTYIIYGATQILLAILRAAEAVKIGFYVSLSSFGINILLNYVLIYGKLGFPEMGIKGAAAATLVSRIIELSVVIIYMFFIDKKLKFRIGELFRSTREMIKLFMKKGLPLFASSVSWGIAMSIQGSIIGRLVESAIAANSIVTTLFQVSSIFTYAGANAACVLIAKIIGEKAERETIKKRSNGLQLLFLAIGAVSSVILLLIKNLIIGLYNVTPETLHYTNIFTLILSITIIGTSYQCPTLTGIVSGGGDTSFVLRNDIIFMWLIVLPASALSAFVFRFPVAVTFACLKADQILKCPVAFFKAKSLNWIKKIHND
ncbi:MAG: MATE family efflux transporter [Clostridia bacterium]|nr:MATE family efflux transporter [Clostridia bacterium]